MKHSISINIFRIFSIILVISVLISVFSPALPARAEDSFPSPDKDNDGLANTLETAGWYNLAGGPYFTNPNDRDSDNDGLTEGEEKLFNTNPLDSHSPGIAVRYEDSFNTQQYFNTTDTAYLKMIQGGDQFLLTEALVVRRGTTFNITGPTSGTLTIGGTGMTTLTPVKDPARGGWKIILPTNGTVGTYIATITDGSWTKDYKIYVIFELPTDLPANDIAAFLYDGDPANKKDEVAVWWRTGEWPYYGKEKSTIQPCPETGEPTSYPCSYDQYHYAYGYAQAYWTMQFTKSNLIDHAIKAIQGKTSQSAAVPAIAAWTDTEFRTRSGRVQNSFTSAMYKWFDGTDITMAGGYCESTASTFTAILRSAGIPAHPFIMDYNKTAGHGESGQIGNQWALDTSTMMWYNGAWSVQRAYNHDEVGDLYYPWNHGVSSISLLKDWPATTSYYTDNYADTIVSANAGWDFQTGTSGDGMVNTTWPIPNAEFVSKNRDYSWNSKYPLQITQSPYVDVLVCQMWKGDKWAPSEWSGTSNPAGRSVAQTYFLPTGVPNPANPLENYPFNPQPTACSGSTPTAVCNAFKATWSTSTCTVVAGGGRVYSSTPEERVADLNSIYLPIIGTKPGVSIQLGNIINDSGLDLDKNGKFDELVVDVEITSSQAGEFNLGGQLLVGNNAVSNQQLTEGNSFQSESVVKLIKGTQTVQLSFDGQEIGDNRTDGPYNVQALWVTQLEQGPVPIAEALNTLAYQTFTYQTKPYPASDFVITAALLADSYSNNGVDENGDGLFEAITIDIGLNISIPGTFQVSGDLYDGQGNYLGHASWTGTDDIATLKFEVAETQPPYTLENLVLIDQKGPMLDSRTYRAYEINDMAGLIESSIVAIGNPAENGVLGVTPNTFTFIPVDGNGDGKYETLRVDVGVTVTDHGGSYRIEGLLVDEHGKQVAWSVSVPQALVVGPQTMILDFDGKMIYDQLPLVGSQMLKLIAVKIFSGNLSSTTLENQAPVAATTPAYMRSQFGPSSPAVTLFQDDLESGTGKWTSISSPWSLDSGTWHSWSHAFKASATGAGTRVISLASPLNLSDYAAPELRFNNAYQMNTSNGKLEVSTDGTNWTTLATYTGSTPHWLAEQVNMSTYGETANVRLRFNALSNTTGLLWYIDDVYINAWPAVKTASFTYIPSSVMAGTDTTFTASYTSIITTLPITYKWNFCGALRETTSPILVYQFPIAGNCAVTLTVQNPYDSAVTSQTIYVNSSTGQYTLTVIANPAYGGTVIKNPDKTTYNPSEVVTVSATSAEGYTFTSWSGACSGSNACVVTMDGNKSVTANFTPVQYSLTISVVGQGLVTKNPDQLTYSYGQQVLLTPTPATGWSFSVWSGACTGTGACVVTVDGNKSVTATFTQARYTLTVTSFHGVVSRVPNQATYTYGQTVVLTMGTVEPGWIFTGWSGGGCIGIAPCTVTMNGDITVTASFAQIEYSLAVNVLPNTDGGMVTKNPDKATYHYGEVVQLTAYAASGWHFVNWSGGVTGSANPTSITIDGNKSVTATFVQEEYELIITVVGNGHVDINYEGPYHYHDIVIMTAVPDTGWVFFEWSGARTGPNNPMAVTINENTYVTATFNPIAIDTFTLTVIQPENGSINPTGGTYDRGTVVNLTATPADGYHFVEWTGACTGSGACSVTMDADKTVSAKFAINTITYVLTVNQSAGGTIAPPTATYDSGMVVELTATADLGYHLVEWTGACSGSGACSVTMDADKTVSATFIEDLNLTLPQNLIVNSGTLREGFETLNGWTVKGSGSGYSAALDTINFKEGAAIKLTTPSTTGYVSISKPVTWDLSADPGNLRFWVYVYGSSAPTGGGIILSSDSLQKNYFISYYGNAFRLFYRPGWNLINLRLSDWSTVGTPNWANIVNLRIQLNSTSVNTYSFDALTSGVIARPAVLFTILDSDSSLYTQAYAYMQPRNVRGTGYNVTDWVGGVNRVSWAQLQEMYSNGWTIGNHTKAHIDLTSLSLDGQTTALLDARNAFNDHGLFNVDYVNYPMSGAYNADTLTAMQNLGMRTGQSSILSFNNVSPLARPFEIATRSIGSGISLATAEGWVNTALSHQEILVLTFNDITTTPTSVDWYIDRFQSLVDYCIAQGIPIITMDDLYRLQTSDITIPLPK